MYALHFPRPYNLQRPSLIIIIDQKDCENGNTL